MPQEVVSIQAYETSLAPYWRRAYAVADSVAIPAEPLASAVTSAASILSEVR